jgi:hypothetical protein
MSTSPRHDPTDLPGALGADYAAGDQHRPLAGYAILTATFGVALGGGLLVAHRQGRSLPETVGVYDVVLIGVATHKLSRLLTKDKVTSVLRAPFTRFQEKAGHGEVEEAARGHGLRLAVGELLVCPYCIAQWVAGAFSLGLVFAPRLTRLLAGMWSAHAIADAAQLAYRAAERRS